MKISKVEDQYEIIFHRSVWPEEQRELHFVKKSFESLKPKIVKQNVEHGSERARGESPRAHIRRGRSYGLYDASGSPPDLI